MKRANLDAILSVQAAVRVARGNESRGGAVVRVARGYVGEALGAEGRRLMFCWCVGLEARRFGGNGYGTWGAK